jgi:hypothetical protein
MTDGYGNFAPAESGEKLLNRSEAAKWLTARGFHIAPQTLAKYAVVGGGPLFHKFGRRPLYPVQCLRAWAENKLSRLRRTTSDLRSAPRREAPTQDVPGEALAKAA